MSPVMSTPVVMPTRYSFGSWTSFSRMMCLLERNRFMILLNQEARRRPHPYTSDFNLLLEDSVEPSDWLLVSNWPSELTTRRWWRCWSWLQVKMGRNDAGSLTTFYDLELSTRRNLS